MANKDKIISQLITKNDLIEGLKKVGLKEKMTIEVHSSLSSFGYVVGASQSVVDALLEVVGFDGTIAMSLQTSENSEPSAWCNPPIERQYYQVIRDNMPSFDKKASDCFYMGKVVDNFRRREGVVMSNSIQSTYVAWGKYARLICGHQPLHFPLGNDSPTSHLYDLDASCLLLGVDYDSATCLHLAEYRSNYREVILNGGAVEIDNQRVWKKYLDLNIDSDDFIQIGKLLEEKKMVNIIKINNAEVKLFKIRPAVNLAIEYFNKLANDEKIDK